jgi:subtilisin family serine protease
MVGLTSLMLLTSGTPDIAVALLDGPVDRSHPDLAHANIRSIGDSDGCHHTQSVACAHGTFVAGVLVAKRGSQAPAIAPGCTLLVRPIFHESGTGGQMPIATPASAATAIVDSTVAGARIVNLSAATVEPTTRSTRVLRDALNYAASRGTLVIAAAGNQGTLGSSEITRHPGVIPVAAYTRHGRPMTQSNLGQSLAQRGIGAPGDRIVSLRPGGDVRTWTGTSFAAPFVTGAVALLWSLFPAAPPGVLRNAVTGGNRRSSVIPSLLNAAAAYERLRGASTHENVTNTAGLDLL